VSARALPASDPPALGSEAPANLQPSLLQFTRATAVPERSSDANGVAPEESYFSPSERAARYEQWLAEQGLKRLGDELETGPNL
jgi:hypothetical protein